MHTVTVQVADGSGATDSEDVVVTVSDSNANPALATIGPKSVNELVLLEFNATATDGDAGDTLTFSLTGTVPTGATINSNTGAFSWTPSELQDGSHSIAVRVSDGSGGSASETVVVTVSEVNEDPVLTLIGPKSVNELAVLTFTATATDDDTIGGTADTLTFSLTGTVPTGATINSNTGAFSWTPTASQAGVHTVTVQVADVAGATDSEDVAVTVQYMPIMVSSAAYNPGSGQLVITFNQNIGSANYSAIHIRSTGSDSDGITLSGIYYVSYLERIITATLSSEQRAEYGNLDSPQLDVGAGAVTDVGGASIVQTSNIPINDASSKKSSSSRAPVVGINALVQSRTVDIPPHIAELIASRDGSDPLEPFVLDGTFEFPLVIDGYGYLLDDSINTLVPQTVGTGDGSVTIIFTVYTEKDLAHFTLYLNLPDDNTNYVDSDTYIRYGDDGTTSVTDPHGYIADATITVTQEDDSVPEKKTVQITIEFGEEPMGLTNAVAYMWNTDRKAAFVRVIDALEVVAPPPQEPIVQAADPEPVEPDSELPADPEPVTPDLADDATADPEHASPSVLWPADDYDDAHVLSLIRMWSGFESEMITDEQLLELLGLDGYLGTDLPDWMMTDLGVLVAKGDVTVGEFMLALQYVLEHT